jgi:hypothetical protein
LAAAADKNQTVAVSAQPAANGGNKAPKSESTGMESATAVPPSSTKAASNRTRRGAEDNINSTLQNSVASTPSGMSPAQTRNRKATEETTNVSTNGKSNPGRMTRKSVAHDTSSSSSPADLTTSSTAPSGNGAAGNGSNNNTVSTGANGSTAAGNKEDNGVTGKTNTPTEEQRTMKTRSAK